MNNAADSPVCPTRALLSVQLPLSGRPWLGWLVLALALPWLGWLIEAQTPQAQGQIPRVRRYPSPDHFATIDARFNQGEFNQAGELFERLWRSGFRFGQQRWVDSLCYHAMMGECYYRMGKLEKALQEFDRALTLAKAHDSWMLSVQFPDSIQVENAGRIRQIPWGARTRNNPIGAFRDTMLVNFGRLDNQQQAQQGGVIVQARTFQVSVAEVVRCTCLALRRRRELLGPVAPFDGTGAILVGTFSGGIAPPNHWSQAWADVIRGCALAAVGKDAQAKPRLERAALASGQFDHPLTATALFELGRIAMRQGNFEQAIGLFHEASCAAFHFFDAGLLEECFRYGQLAHTLANKPGIYPPLAAAHRWASTKRLDHLESSLAVVLAESAAIAGDLKTAQTALKAARRAMGRRDLPRARVGGHYNYVSAVLSYTAGQVSAGDQALKSALNYMKAGGSFWLLHIGLTDKLYLSGNSNLSPRDALQLYGLVLREPTPADWQSSPLESLAVLVTPHHLQLEHWFRAAVSREQPEAALEIADLARRHRFYSTLFLGGRLLSLRWLLEGPEELLDNESKLQKQDLLAAYPGYVQLAQQSAAIQKQLEALPPVLEGGEQLAAQKKLFAGLASVASKQEGLLRQMAVRRHPAKMTFPPKRRVEDIQKQLPVGHVIWAFFQTSQRVYGFQIGHEDYVAWDVGPPAQVAAAVAGFLKSCGQIDRNRPVDLEMLRESQWAKVSHALAQALSPPGRSLASGIEEVCIVPDGVLWYLPFEALNISTQDPPLTLLAQSRVRYAPTLGLAVSDGRGRRRLPTTLVTVGQLMAGESEGLTDQGAENLVTKVPGTLTVDEQVLPGPGALYARLFDRVICYHDLAGAESAGLAWSPLAPTKPSGGQGLSDWLLLPWGSPEQMILPGFHSAAASALGKRARGANGGEIFLNSMAMMASGTRTVLMSRWRVGGRTTLDLTREYLRELEQSDPADAWQRSVLLVQNTPIDVHSEPRVERKSTRRGDRLNASHPFFWAGYLLIDSGRPLGPAAGQPVVDASKLLELEKKRKLLEQAREAARRQREAQQK